jgi:hypothetical protein
MGHFRRIRAPYAVLTAGGATTGAAGAATAGAFLAAAAFLATALTFVFVAFLAADFNFRPRIAFFCIELRFLATVIPPRAHDHMEPGPSYAYWSNIASDPGKRLDPAASRRFERHSIRQAGPTLCPETNTISPEPDPSAGLALSGARPFAV